MFGQMMVEPVVQLESGVDLQTAIATLIKVAENVEIVRWIELPASVLLFLLVPREAAVPDFDAHQAGAARPVPEEFGGREMMMHMLDPQLLERPIRMLVVGCGGNGSAIVSGLPYLHQAMLAFGHPGGLQVTLIDPDTVSETNCVRQPFCRTEIGFPKAIVLAHRINLFWGLHWQGMQATIQQLKKGSDVELVIGCVDTRKARRAIDKWALNSRVLYWLDLGNNASSGQFVLGQPKNFANRKRKDRLPTVAELYPEILKRDRKEDEQPSCSAAEALTRQEPFINQNLAYQALGMLTQLLRHGSVSYQGGFCNLATGQLVPLSARDLPRNCLPKRRGRRTNSRGLGVAKSYL